ncbi:MAG: hypothetical protein IKV98_02580 [Clostridia bacterium]|nr:hypothetical protein [Clostridia bacterium]
MDFFKMFISEYGTTLMYTVIVGIFAYLGAQAKIFADKYFTDKTKKDVAKTVVRAVEQIYHDLCGEEKLSKALESASAMLSDRGIYVSELEMRMLLEAAISEFKGAFEVDKNAEKI